MGVRANWILRNDHVINGSEVLGKSPFSSKVFLFCVFFKTRKMDVLQGLVQGIIRPWALYSFIISLIPARVRWSKAYDVGEKLTWIYLNYYQEC